MKMIAYAAAALLLASGAAAETFTPLPVLGSTQLDLDTQDGHYCGWFVDDLGPVNALRTTLQVHRRGSDPKWVPSFSITLKNGDKRVSLNIWAPLPALPMVVRVEQPGDKPDEVGQLLGKLDMDTPVDVAIDWTADGQVTIRAGGQTATASLGAPVKSLEITGSTGEIEFNPLQIGTAAP